MKNRKIETVLQELPGASRNTRRWAVRTTDRVLLGFLEKGTNTDTEQHPWKVFLPRFVAGQHPQFGELLGAYYGGQEYAINALIAVELNK